MRSTRSDPTAGTNGNRPTLSLDAVLGALSDSRRRDILLHLYAGPDVAPAAALADAFVERETDRGGTRPNRDAVAAAVFHRHLPHLADLGAIEYDDRLRTVRYRDSPRLETWIERVLEETDDDAA